MESNSSAKVYPSKVSYFLLAFIFVLMYMPFIFSDYSDMNTEQTISFFIILIISIGILYIFFGTKYIISGGNLIIKIGAFTSNTIPIEDITEVSKSRNWISSPAPSLDRLEIKYGKYNSVLISPKNKKAFCKDVQKINPDIQIVGVY